MRKALLVTTALTVVSAIGTGSSADAAERLKARVGGYMQQYFGYTDNDTISGEDTTGADVKSDTEIWFLGQTTLDNGIEFGVRVELEGNTSSDQIDESYLTVEGAFGQIVIGSENSAMYRMHAAPEDAGFGLNSGDNVDWISFTGVGEEDGLFRGPFGSTFVEPNRVNDVNRISYYSPRLSGFQFGASYVPDAVEDSNALVDRNASLHDGVTVGANYTRSIGEVDFKMSAGWGRMSLGDNVSGDDPTSYNLGLTLGYDGFSAGVSYAEAEDDTAVGDMTGYSVGVSYQQGPYTVALLGFFSERDGSATANAGGSGARAASYDTVHLEGAVELGPGVTLIGVLGRGELTDDSGFGQDNTAVYGVTSIELSF